MQRGEGLGVGNGLDSRRVDVVDHDKGMLVQEPKQPEYYNICKQNTKSIQQHNSSSGTQTDSGSVSKMTSSMTDARDNTINNKYCY